MLDNLRIKTQLAMLTGVMAVLLLATAVGGLVTAQHARDGLRVVYTQHTVAAIKLAQVRDALQRLRLAMAVGVTNNDRDAGRKTLAEIPDIEAKVETGWAAFVAVGGHDDEAELIKRFSEANAAYTKARHATLDIYNQDPDAGERQMRSNGGKRMLEALATVDELLSVQERKAQTQYLAAESELHGAFILTMVLLAAAVALGGGLALLIGRSIDSGITGSIAVMMGLADGRLDVVIDGGGRRDEVGDMARALAVLRDKLTQGHRAVEAQAAEQAERGRRAGLLDGLARTFDADTRQVMELVSKAAESLREASGTMATVAQRTAGEASAVAAATTEASESVNTVAAAAAQLSASVIEIGRQVESSSEISTNAVAAAQRTDALVRGLSEAANRIGEVVTLINDIAGQTNLLALNATIEAARAGEAGKGFAVVAGEVKNLASQTAKATDDISVQVNAVQSATGEAVEAIRHIATIIGRLSEATSTIAAAVQEQGAATNEIARSAEQAASGTQQVAQYIDSMTQDADETGRVAHLVAEQADAMTRQSGSLQHCIAEFLANVRKT